MSNFCFILWFKHQRRSTINLLNKIFISDWSELCPFYDIIFGCPHRVKDWFIFLPVLGILLPPNRFLSLSVAYQLFPPMCLSSLLTCCFHFYSVIYFLHSAVHLSSLLMCTNNISLLLLKVILPFVHLNVSFKLTLFNYIFCHFTLIIILNILQIASILLYKSCDITNVILFSGEILLIKAWKMFWWIWIFILHFQAHLSWFHILIHILQTFLLASLPELAFWKPHLW